MLPWDSESISPAPAFGRTVEHISRWWFQIFFFHPYLGKISNLTNIFQMG